MKTSASLDARQGLITFEITSCDLCSVFEEEEEEEEVGHNLPDNVF